MNKKTLLEKHLEHYQKVENEKEREVIERYTKNFNLIHSYINHYLTIEEIERGLIEKGLVFLTFKGLIYPPKILSNEKVILTNQKNEKYTEEWKSKGVTVTISSDSIVYSLDDVKNKGSLRLTKSKEDFENFKKENENYDMVK